MISNQHANRATSRRTSESSAAIEQRQTSIKAELQTLDKKNQQLCDNTEKRLSKEHAAVKVTPEKHTPQRSRTYACSSIDEVAQAFELDVQKGKLTERSPPRGRTYAISGIHEFRQAFPVEDSPEQNSS